MTTDAGGQEGRPRPGLLALFLGFMRIAAFSFGGVLPWARFLLVERRRWITAEEFTDTLALAQLLPGPNIVNVSVAIGARFHGPAGSLAALGGLLLLPIAIVLALVRLYAGFAHLPAVRGGVAAMAAAAAGLVLAMAVKMAWPVLRNRFGTAAPVILATFVAVALMRWPLWPVVGVMAPLAVALAWRRR